MPGRVILACDLCCCVWMGCVVTIIGKEAEAMRGSKHTFMVRVNCNGLVCFFVTRPLLYAHALVSHTS